MLVFHHTCVSVHPENERTLLTGTAAAASVHNLFLTGNIAGVAGAELTIQGFTNTSDEEYIPYHEQEKMLNENKQEENSSEGLR